MDGILEELQAVQAQRALGEALLDAMLNLELRDHHSELALAVMRLGSEVLLEAKQHRFVIDQHPLA